MQKVTGFRCGHKLKHPCKCVPFFLTHTRTHAIQACFRCAAAVDACAHNPISRSTSDRTRTHTHTLAANALMSVSATVLVAESGWQYTCRHGVHYRRTTRASRIGVASEPEAGTPRKRPQSCSQAQLDKSIGALGAVSESSSSSSDAPKLSKRLSPMSQPSVHLAARP